MSALLQWLGLQTPAKVKAAQVSSREAFQAQLDETSVTYAGRRHNVLSRQLDRELKRQVAESRSQTRRHH